MKLHRLSVLLLCALTLPAQSAPHNTTITEHAEQFLLTPEDSQVTVPLNRVILFGDSLSDIGNTQQLLKVLKDQADPAVIFKPFNTDVEYSWVNKLFTYLGINSQDLNKIEIPLVKPLIKLFNKFVTVPIYPDPNYHDGRFSNGPVWNEWLMEMIGLPVSDPTRYINRAYGGSWATRVSDSPKINWSSWKTIEESIVTIVEGKVIPPGMTPLVKAYLDEYPPIAGKSWMQGSQAFISLYGGNDYISGNNAPARVVLRISEEINKLAVYAAKSASKDQPGWFIIGNIPDLASTPRYRTGSQKKNAGKISALIKQHNQLLEKQVEHWKAYYRPQNLHFELLDAYSLVKEELATEGEYRIKDKPCYNQDLPGSDDFKEPAALQMLDVKPCDNPDDYAFWDQIHPTRKMHARIAYRACETSFKKFGGHCWLPDYTNPAHYPKTARNP